MALEPALLAFAATAGVFAFFSPCSIALLPAYVGYFVGTPDAPRTTGRAALAGAGFGAWASLAFVLLFAALGAAVLAARRNLLGDTLPYIGLGVGAVLVLLGGAQLLGRGPSFAWRLPLLRRKTPLGFAAFGAAYGLASLGCTFPLFLAVVVGAAAAGSWLGGLAVFFVYAAGMAALMIALSAVLAASREAVVAQLRAAVPVVSRVSAAVVLAAGAYVVYYYAAFLQASR